MRRGLIVGLVVVLMAGCATRQVSSDKASAVPAQGRFASQGDAELTIIRDAGFSGAGCSLVVTVNGETAAKLETGQKVTLAMQSGKWIVGAHPDGNSLCRSSLAQRNKRETQVSIDKGDHLVYRLAADQAGAMSIAPTTDQ